MLRLSLVLLVLAGCGGKAASGEPAWPKSAGWVTPETWEEDGGESLEPRAGGVAGVERSDEPAEAPADDLDVEAPVEEPAIDEGPPAEEAPPPPDDDDQVPDDAIIIEDEGEPEP